METPIFVARDPRVFTVQHAPPKDGRIFVTDQSRWYERVKDDNGNASFVHVADSDEEFQQRLEEDGEPAAVEIEDDPLGEIALTEFAQAGRLYPEVPVIMDDDVMAA